MGLPRRPFRTTGSNGAARTKPALQDKPHSPATTPTTPAGKPKVQIPVAQRPTLTTAPTPTATANVVLPSPTPTSNPADNSDSGSDSGSDSDSSSNGESSDSDTSDDESDDGSSDKGETAGTANANTPTPAPAGTGISASRTSMTNLMPVMTSNTKASGSGSMTSPSVLASSPTTDGSESTQIVSSPSSPTHTGAIVGGAVGGIALLIFAALALNFYLRRRRRKRTAPSAEFLEFFKRHGSLLSTYRFSRNFRQSSAFHSTVSEGGLTSTSEKRDIETDRVSEQTRITFGHAV